MVHAAELYVWGDQTPPVILNAVKDLRCCPYLAVEPSVAGSVLVSNIPAHLFEILRCAQDDRGELVPSYDICTLHH